VKLSAGGCTRPDGWTGGVIYFGMNDPRAGQDPVKGQRGWVSSSTAWQDQLVIPSGLAPGSYWVWANCYGSDPSGTVGEFYYYESQEFVVT
jgi:hypothetical protein